MRSLVILSLILLASLGCKAPTTHGPPKTIAVVGIRIVVNVPHTLKEQDFTEDYATPLTEAVESAFVSTGHYSVVERARLDSVQRELVKSLDDVWFDQDQTAKIGKFKGAKLLVLPTARLEIGLFSTSLTLQVKVADVETGAILRTYTVNCSSYSPSINGSITKCLRSVKQSLETQLSQQETP